MRDARTRLEYFDVPAGQIEKLKRGGKVQKTVTIRAPFTGIVTHKNVVEGDKVGAGMDLFKLADLSTVWVMAKVFEYDLPFVQLGQEAFMTLSYLPGRTFRGRVTYIYPYLDTKTRTVSVRIEFHNPGYELKPGMYATVTLTGKLAESATLVPDVAVIRTGERSVAFVTSEPGRFEPREVEIGARAENNYLQVLSGLAPGETVVVSGQFLLDSESRLREAALKFMEPGAAGGANPIEDVTSEAAGESRGQRGQQRSGRRRGVSTTSVRCPSTRTSCTRSRVSARSAACRWCRCGARPGTSRARASPTGRARCPSTPSSTSRVPASARSAACR